MADGMKASKEVVSVKTVMEVVEKVGMILQMFPKTAVLGTLMSAVAGPFVESDDAKSHRLLNEVKAAIANEHKETRAAIED